jgi:hypothetical protein
MLGVLWLAGLAWVSANPECTDWWHNGSLVGFLGYWWIGAKFTDPAFAGGDAPADDDGNRQPRS